MLNKYISSDKNKAFFRRIFIDGLNGMSLGLFSTLIIGLIIEQIGKVFPSGSYLCVFLTNIGKILSILTGCGIGCAVAHNIKAPKLAIYSSMTAGFIAAHCDSFIKSINTENISMIFQGPGNPLSAFIASVVAAELGRIVFQKTKVDILVVPLVTIISGCAISVLFGPGISKFITIIGNAINSATELQPFFMGIIVSVSMGMLLTLPISSAAIAIMLGLSGLAGGAATAGCSAQMIGFAVISFKDNGFNGFISQGIGTSMLQMPNIIKNPKIWLPPIFASAICGPIASCVLKMKTLPSGSGMGTSGLVGQIMTYNAMSSSEKGYIIILKILLIDFILPAMISYAFYKIMKNKKYIKPGDMKLDN